MDIIEDKQNQLNEIIRNTSNKDMIYENIVRPIVAETLAIFKERDIAFFPRTEYILPIDLYVEMITTHVLNNYANEIINDELPDECYILMLIRYPYFINILQCNKTFKQYIAFRNKLVNTFNIMYPVVSNQAVINVYKLLTTKIEDTYDIRTCSTPYYFHYFAGFRFEKEYVAITADQLPKGQTISYFIINLTYNMTDINAIVLYKDSPKIKSKILKLDNIPKYKCINKPTTTVRATLPFISTNDSFYQLSYYTTNVYVLLCYNDNEDISKCHFTIALYGKEGNVDSTFVNNMILGMIPKTLSDEEVNNYVEMTFQKSFSDTPESLNVVKEECKMMRQIVSDVLDDLFLKYEEDGEKIVMIKFFDDVTNSLMRKKELRNILDETEMPFFKLYMGNMATELCNMIVTMDDNVSQKHSKFEIAEYVLKYLYDDEFNDRLYHD